MEGKFVQKMVASQNTTLKKKSHWWSGNGKKAGLIWMELRIYEREFYLNEQISVTEIR